MIARALVIARRSAGLALVLSASGLATVAGCVKSLPSPSAGQIVGLELQMVDPDVNHLGSPQQPITVQKATFNLIAHDDSGAVVPGDADVQVFVSFGGVKSGGGAGCDTNDDLVPIDTVHLSAGTVMNHTVTIPQAFGPTSIWLDEPISHASGASPTIFFRNPYISDVQRPPDLTAANAAYCTPFEKKFVVVDGAMGKLVVNSVFGDSFTVTDTGAPTFNSLYIFNFGRPPSYIVPGKMLTSFSGNISKFIGFTEVNFPIFDAPADPPDATLLPAPPVLKGTDTADLPKLLGYSAATVKTSGVVCNPMPDNPSNDSNVQNTIDQWVKFNTFILDSGSQACDSFTSFAIQLPQKVVGGFDPTMNVGKPATFIGMLKNASGQNLQLDPTGNPIACDPTMPMVCGTGACLQGQCHKNPFNFWTIVVRDSTDVSLP